MKILFFIFLYNQGVFHLEAFQVKLAVTVRGVLGVGSVVAKVTTQKSPVEVAAEAATQVGRVLPLSAHLVYLIRHAQALALQLDRLGRVVVVIPVIPDRDHRLRLRP